MWSTLKHRTAIFAKWRVNSFHYIFFFVIQIKLNEIERRKKKYMRYIIAVKVLLMKHPVYIGLIWCYSVCVLRWGKKFCTSNAIKQREKKRGNRLYRTKGTFPSKTRIDRRNHRRHPMRTVFFSSFFNVKLFAIFLVCWTAINTARCVVVNVNIVRIGSNGFIEHYMCLNYLLFNCQVVGFFYINFLWLFALSFGNWWAIAVGFCAFFFVYIELANLISRYRLLFKQTPECKKFSSRNYPLGHLFFVFIIYSYTSDRIFHSISLTHWK